MREDEWPTFGCFAQREEVIDVDGAWSPGLAANTTKLGFDRERSLEKRQRIETGVGPQCHVEKVGLGGSECFRFDNGREIRDTRVGKLIELSNRLLQVMQSVSQIRAEPNQHASRGMAHWPHAKNI